VSVKLDYKGKLTCTYPEYEEELKPFIRNGFTVVEWGGTKVN
jgi:hypothetical protein